MLWIYLMIIMLKRFFCKIIYGAIFLIILLFIYNTEFFDHDLIREHELFLNKYLEGRNKNWSFNITTTTAITTSNTTTTRAVLLRERPRQQPLVTIFQFKEHAIKYLHQRPFLKYINNLSHYQVNDLIRQVGVTNLTSDIAKRQFMFCGMFSLVRRKDAPSDHVVLPKGVKKCKKMSFRNSGVSVALVSYPGSGNSWVRVLLEEATGIYTGSIYCDKHYLYSGMIGEGISTENVIAFKSHSSVEEMVQYSKKVVYIIRNPLKAIVAEYTRQTAKRGHTQELPPEYYGANKEWDKTVTKMANEWKQHIEQWTQTDKFVKLILCYENMISNLYTVLKNMLDFVEYQYTEDEIACVIKSANDEKFHRKHSYIFDPYTPNQKEYVMMQIKSVHYILSQYNISYI